MSSIEHNLDFIFLTHHKNRDCGQSVAALVPRGLDAVGISGIDSACHGKVFGLKIAEMDAERAEAWRRDMCVVDDFTRACLACVADNSLSSRFGGCFRAHGKGHVTSIVASCAFVSQFVQLQSQ